LGGREADAARGTCDECDLFCEVADELLPRFVRHRARQGVTMRPVAEREATWDIVLAWQPGRMTGALHALLDAFAAEGAKNKKQQATA
jgi:hypothetical protein